MDHQDGSAMREAAEAFERARIRVQRLEPRLRRFTTAIHDLGILHLVGREWVQITEDESGFTFADIDERTFDRLVSALEGGTQRRRSPADATPGQLNLSPEILAPVTGDRPSGIHVEVPR